MSDNVHDVFNVNPEVMRDLIDSKYSFQIKNLYKDESFMTLYIYSLHSHKRLGDTIWTEDNKCDVIAYTMLELLKIEPSEAISYLTLNDYDEIYANTTLKKLSQVEKIQIIQKVLTEYLRIDTDLVNYRKDIKSLYKLLGIKNEPKLDAKDGEVIPIPKYLCIEENRELFEKIAKKITKPFIGNREDFLRSYTPTFLKRNGLGNVIKYVYGDHFSLLIRIYPEQFMPWDLKLVSTKDNIIEPEVLTKILEHEVWIRSSLTESDIHSMLRAELNDDIKEKPLTKFLKRRRIYSFYSGMSIEEIFNLLNWKDETKVSSYKTLREYLLDRQEKGKLEFGFSIEDGIDDKSEYTYVIKFRQSSEGYEIEFPNFKELNRVVPSLQDVFPVSHEVLDSFFNMEDTEDLESKIQKLDSFDLNDINLEDRWFTSIVPIIVDKTRMK